MYTASHEQRLAELHIERQRAMTAARVARAFGCDELMHEMVDDAREQHYHIMHAKQQAHGVRLHVVP